MGCCISSNNTNDSPNHHHFPSNPAHSDKTHLDNRAPPLCPEEETVKEVVLSETRLPKPESPSPNETEPETHTLHHIHIPVIHEPNTEARDLISTNKNEQEIEISQASEICSTTESFSNATTTTTTVTETREDEAISKSSTRRSPAKVSKKRPYTGENSRGVKSTATRAEVSRSAQGRTMPCNVRSRSPTTRTVAGVGRSPGKVGARAGVRTDKSKEEKEVQKEVNDDALENNNNMESVDNPHVSLECFIFL